MFASYAGVVNPTKPNSGSDRKTASVRKKIWNSRIRDREGIERIRDWHANASWTKPHIKTWDLERIGRERHCGERCIKVGADEFKVRKRRQVFVADIARKRAVEALAIRRSERGRYRSKIIEEVIASALVIRAGLWTELERMRPNDTWRARIGVGINRKRVLIKRGSLRIWCRVRRR